MKRFLALLLSTAVAAPGPLAAQALSEAVVEPLSAGAPLETQAPSAPAPETLQLAPASILDPFSSLGPTASVPLSAPLRAPAAAPLRTAERPTSEGLRAIPGKLVEKEPAEVLEGTFDLRRRAAGADVSLEAPSSAIARPTIRARTAAAAVGIAASLYSATASALPDGFDGHVYRGRDGVQHMGGADAIGAAIAGLFLLATVGFAVVSNVLDRRRLSRSQKLNDQALAWSQAEKPFFTEVGAEPAAGKEADSDFRPWYKKFRLPWRKAATADDSPVVLAAATPNRRSASKKEKQPKKVMFADVAGQEEAKAELQQVVDVLKNPGRYRDLGGEDFDPFKGVLLYGPPGTGKTLLARAVANEAGAAFFQASGSDFVERLVGVGASRVRELIEKARATGRPAIIFIDELDAMGKKRSEDGSGNSEYEQTLNALLTAMDGFEKNKIVFMAATNRVDTLDPALVRGKRFGLKVPVGRPDVAGREAVLKVQTAKTKLGADVDLRTIAQHTPGLAGADLADVVTDAVMIAARRDAKAVEMRDFNAAVDRKTIGHDRNRVMSPRDKLVTAHHEAGHALVSHFLAHGDPVRTVTIIPKDLGALGVMQTVAEDEKLIYSKSWLVDRMAIALGGRAGEELTGDVYSGVADDLENATHLARLYVMKFGMSEKVGRVSFDLDGARTKAGQPLSDRTKRLIDAEVRSLLEQAYERAKRVIEEHRDSFDAMSSELLEKETLREDDLARLLPAKAAP